MAAIDSRRDSMADWQNRRSRNVGGHSALLGVVLLLAILGLPWPPKSAAYSAASGTQERADFVRSFQEAGQQHLIPSSADSNSLPQSTAPTGNPHRRNKPETTKNHQEPQFQTTLDPSSNPRRRSIGGDVSSQSQHPHSTKTPLKQDVVTISRTPQSRTRRVLADVSNDQQQEGDDPSAQSEQGKAEKEFDDAKLLRKQGDCWSRNELHLFHTPFLRTQYFEDELLRYEKMHARCMNVSNWVEYSEKIFPDKNEDLGSLSGCQYLLYVPPQGHGIGNQIISLIPAFVLAMLTNRALILRGGDPLSEFLCNPFPDSDWVIDKDTWQKFTGPMWVKSKQVYFLEEEPELWNSWEDKRLLVAGVNWNSGKNAEEIFCAGNYERIIDKVPFLAFESDMYYVPGLFFVPKFEKELRKLFPDNRVFLHVGRHILLPQNFVWLRVIRYYNTYLAHHSKRVGIQVRKFWPVNETIDERLMDCVHNVARVVSEGKEVVEFLKTMTPGEHSPAFLGKEASGTGIIVTSLNRSHADVIKDYVETHVPTNGELVAVYSPSHEERESQSMHQEAQAFQEMILLSMCDILLTTEFSTFGYVAAGLSGVAPFSMDIIVNNVFDFRTSTLPACQQVSSEPVFHVFPGKSDNLKCGEEVRALWNIVEGVKRRQPGDYGLIVDVVDCGLGGLSCETPNEKTSN